MRVLITGSRQFLDRPFLYATLDEVGAACQEAGEVDLVIVHGGAAGADTLANDWCWDRRGAQPSPLAEPHPVNWAPLGYYDSSQGKARNIEMLRSKPDLILAFFANGAANSGTRHCVTAAPLWAPGIEVREYWR